MNPINLQFTTSTLPLPDFIYEGLKAYSANANGYRPQPTVLIEKLSKKYALPPEMIYLTAGVDEAIQMFALAFGKKAVFFSPTYSVYNDIKDFYANVTAIDAVKDERYSIPTKKIPDATLIFLANPNNPFGHTEKVKIFELVSNNSHACVIIDEVYAEFADLSVIDAVKNYPNLVVFRSFSKSYGMAGNRIGFFVASPQVIAHVKTKTQWANVSYLSVGAAMVALDHEDYFNSLRAQVIKTRETTLQFLQTHGFHLFPSLINCVLIKFENEEKGTHFAKYLVDNNFVISHGNGSSNVGLDKSFVRISIGTEEEMKILMKTIEGYKQ